MMRHTILIVEDEALIAMDLETLLKEAGYDVAGPANTTTAAMELISGVAIAAAILDANLHGESSSTIARALSAANIPYVLVTGYDSGNLPPALQNAACFQKPYDSKLLLLSLKLMATPVTLKK